MPELIDREAVLKAFSQLSIVIPARGNCKTITAKIMEEMYGIVHNAPAIEAETVRHGRWILTGRTNVYGGKEVECSECGFRVMLSPEHIENITEYERYCCHCGLRMDGGAENG